MPDFGIILIVASLNPSGKYPADKAALKIALSLSSAWWGRLLRTVLLIPLLPGQVVLLDVMAWVSSRVEILQLSGEVPGSLVGSAVLKGVVLCTFSCM